MKKRILALFLVTVLTFSLSSCNQTENVPSEVTEKTSAVTEIESIPVPEGGWTRESLNDVIYINGVNYEFPLTLEKLGEDYEYRDTDIIGDKVSSRLYYKGKENVFVFFDLTDKNLLNEQTEIVQIGASYCFDPETEEYLNNEGFLKINGLALESSYFEIFEKLGEPYEFSDDSVTSDKVPDKAVGIFYKINFDDELYSISISYSPFDDSILNITILLEE